MYKFIAIEIEPEKTLFFTIDMLKKDNNFKTPFFTKGLKELSKIYKIVECETKNLELYQAILNQDYKKINELLK